MAYNPNGAGGDLTVSLGPIADLKHTFVLPAALSLVDGDWHHIVMTYDADTDLLSAHVDSLLAGQVTVAGDGLDELVRSGLVVGEHPGDYSDVAVYASALSAEQVSRHYTLGIDPDGGECVAIGGDVYGAAVVDSAPVGYLPLDRSVSAEVAYDASPGCGNGSFATGTAVTDGPAGSSAVSSADRAAVAFANWDGLPGGGESRSVELWFRGSTDPGNRWLARYGSAVGLAYNPNGAGGDLTVSLGPIADLKHTFVLPAALSLVDGDWHHIVMTYDADTDLLSAYVDSSLTGQVAIIGDALNLPVRSGLVVGEHPGDYADVAVYASALTPAQVLAHFGARTP